MLAPVLTAARSRLAAAFPGAADRSGDPHPKQAAGAAFAVAVNVTGSEPVGMADGARIVTGTLAVTLWPVPTRPRTDAAGLVQDAAAAVRAAILADPPDLGGAAWSVELAGADPEVAAGNERIARVDVTFDVSAIVGSGAPPA